MHFRVIDFEQSFSWKIYTKFQVRRKFISITLPVTGREAVEWLQMYLRDHEVTCRRELNELHVVHLMRLLLRCGFIVCLWQHFKHRNPLDVRKNLYSFSPLQDSDHNMTQKLFLAFVLSSPIK